MVGSRDWVATHASTRTLGAPGTFAGMRALLTTFSPSRSSRTATFAAGKRISISLRDGKVQLKTGKGCAVGSAVWLHDMEAGKTYVANAKPPDNFRARVASAFGLCLFLLLLSALPEAVRLGCGGTALAAQQPLWELPWYVLLHCVLRAVKPRAVPSVSALCALCPCDLSRLCVIVLH
jgi:hypothetical protein